MLRLILTDHTVQKNQTNLCSTFSLAISQRQGSVHRDHAGTRKLLWGCPAGSPGIWTPDVLPAPILDLSFLICQVQKGFDLQSYDTAQCL